MRPAGGLPRLLRNPGIPRPRVSIYLLHIRKAVHFEEFFLVGFGADEHDFFEAAVSFVNKTRDLFAGADAAADDRPQVFAVKINYFFFLLSSKHKIPPLSSDDQNCPMYSAQGLYLSSWPMVVVSPWPG